MMNLIKQYCDAVGKRLRWSRVRNEDFFNRFDYLTPEPQANDDPQYTYAPVVDDREVTGKIRTCPACDDPLKGEHGTFCPRCSWSEADANIDSDPLSNPPDPTIDMHRGIQSRIATNRSLYHGTLIDHLPSIREHGLRPDVGEFTSEAYGLDGHGRYDQGDEEPYTAEELGVRPAVYMTDKRDLAKAQTAMTAQIALKLNKEYYRITPEDIAQHGLLVKLKGGEAGYGPDETGLQYAQGDDHNGERPYTVEPGDWWSENESGVGGDMQYITGPKILQVLQRTNTPRPQGWSAEQGQLFNTQPQYDPNVTEDRRFTTTIPLHRWFSAVEDCP